MGAHHLFIARRGEFVEEEVRTFDCTDLIRLPQVRYADCDFTPNPIRRETFMKLYMYSRVLTSLTEQDLMAKIRSTCQVEELLSMGEVTVELLRDVLLVMSKM